MKNKNIVKKLDRVYDILCSYQKDEHGIMSSLCQKTISLYEYDYIIKKYIPSLNYKTRGICLEN